MVDNVNDGIFPNPPGLRRRRITRFYTASCFWTVPEDWRLEDQLLVWLWSAAGAGGGCGATASFIAGYGAPGAFGYACIGGLLLPGQRVLLTIGAGGTPGAAGGNPGGGGGPSSFGSLLTVTGGGGGAIGATTGGTTGTLGAATGADFSFGGHPGVKPTAATALGLGGFPFMTMGGAGPLNPTAANIAGNPGTGFGGPGSGARTATSGATVQAGGAGRPGCAFLQYEAAKDHDSNIIGAVNAKNPMMV